MNLARGARADGLAAASVRPDAKGGAGTMISGALLRNEGGADVSNSVSAATSWAGGGGTGKEEGGKRSSELEARDASGGTFGAGSCDKLSDRLEIGRASCRERG